MDKRVIIAGAAVLGIGAGVAALISWKRHKARSGAQDDLKARLAAGDVKPAEEQLDEEMAEVVRQLYANAVPLEGVLAEAEDEDLVTLDSQKVVPGSAKPELSDIVALMGAMGTIGKEDRMPIRNGYGTLVISFTEDGQPIFPIEDWQSAEGNIELISREEYEGDAYPWDERREAVWFPDPGVLADEDLVAMDVVDTVGPMAFSKLCGGEAAVHVRNIEMGTCFRLVSNDGVSFEEALEDAGGIDAS